MTNDLSALPNKSLPDQALALWMLDRMQDSETFLAVIQAARKKGKPHVLDTPEYVTLHKNRLKQLYASDGDDAVTVPPALIGKIDAIIQRDMISGVEEFFEKAIAAYIEKHPMKAQGLGNDWQTTISAARAEVEGKTSGVFEPDFMAALATSAREEIDRRVEAERDREAGRDGRDD